MTPLRATNVFDKAAELLAQSDEDFIFILNRFCLAYGLVARRSMTDLMRAGREGVEEADRRGMESVPRECARGPTQAQW